MEIGNRLKEAREAKKLSLEDIQAMTKIQTRYLSAIEQGNFEIMPGNFYVRAFIKEYAGAVGLNPEQLMEEHANELPPPTDDTSIQYTRVQRSKAGKDSVSKDGNWFSFLPVLGAVVVIIGILFAVWFFFQSITGVDNGEVSDNAPEEETEEVVVSPEEEPAEEPPAGEEDEVTTEAPVEEEEEVITEEPELELTDQEIQGDDQTLTYTLTNPGEELILELDTNSEHWLEIRDASGDHLYNAMFNKDDAPLEEDLTGEDSFIIRFGNPSALEVTIGGVPLELPEDANASLVHRVLVEVENNEES